MGQAIASKAAHARVTRQKFEEETRQRAETFKTSGALDTLFDLSEINSAKNFGARDWMASLADLFPDASLRKSANQEINALLWRKGDGSDAKVQNGPALFRVWQGLGIIARHWNLDPQNAHSQISLDSLITPDGLRAALHKMRGHSD